MIFEVSSLTVNDIVIAKTDVEIEAVQAVGKPSQDGGSHVDREKQGFIIKQDNVDRSGDLLKRS